MMVSRGRLQARLIALMSSEADGLLGPPENTSAKRHAQELSTLRNELQKQSEQLKELRKIKKAVNEHDAQIGHSIELAERALEMAENTHETAMQAVDIVKTMDLAMDDMLERVTALEARCSKLEDDPGNDGDDESSGVKAAKKKRDNALADAIRACVRSQMHITSFDAKNLPEPLGNGEFWEEVEHEVSGKRVVQRMLRPDWQRSWEENSRGWLLELIERIQTDGWQYSKYPRDQLANTSTAAIQQHIHTWWKGVVYKYNTLHPKTSKKKSVEEDPKQRSRMNARKREVRT
ncbi:hypothetical protein C8T65DRAFT_196772 [Cerioporus squamosus]|nr:hypothetical protein C8T65DRAFT_196772 [Cerioporus squamosus]